MGETSMIPGSGTQLPAEGALQQVTVQVGGGVATTVSTPPEVSLFPVRVHSSDATVVVKVNVELLRQQQEIEATNEAIRRRLRG